VWLAGDARRCKCRRRKRSHGSSCGSILGYDVELFIHMYNIALQYRMVAQEGFDLRANGNQRGCPLCRWDRKSGVEIVILRQYQQTNKVLGASSDARVGWGGAGFYG